METINSLEKTFAGWYAKLPRLPVGARKWLGENVWWIAIIGLILAAFGILGLVVALFAMFGISLYVAVSPYALYDPEWFGNALVAATTGMISIIAQVALLAMAISPLKAKAKKGWTLLFLLLLIQATLSVVTELASARVFGIVWSVIWAGLWGYVLFEIRGEFGVVNRLKKKKTATK